MALVTCDFFSDVLEVGCSMTVVLPQPTEEQIGVEGPDLPAIPRTDFPVLYLLHGLSDDHTAWSRYTSVERYAAAAGLAVVMPAVNRKLLRPTRGQRRPLLGLRRGRSCRRSSATSSASRRIPPTPTSPGSAWVGTAR